MGTEPPNRNGTGAVARDSGAQWAGPACDAAGCGGCPSSTAGAAKPNRPAPRRRPLAGKRGSWRLISLTVAVAFAISLVLVEITERHLFATMPIGWRHALLTIWAATVTCAGSTIVYLSMRGQQRKLSDTAERLARLLESYQAYAPSPATFENPHLLHCRDVLACGRTECPMYDAPGERCWQVIALGGADRGGDSESIGIQRCHECAAYLRSCPDDLTELGEAFNGLLFLLEREARHVDVMRAQMVEKEKMVAIGQMASGVAHEVGNPLSSISSIVQLLKRNRSHASAIDQFELIEKHIDRIAGTVRQMVSFARPGGGQWRRVDVGHTLDDAVQLIAFDRRARNVAIDVDRAKALPTTYGLRDELQQVFINLSLNALDAMPAGGTLRFRARRQRGSIVVDVEDTGCGIPTEMGRRVFEPFLTTKEPGRGTGLGLAVSYGIVQKHGGTIDYASTVGQGTTFTVRLPILDKAPEA